MILAFEVAFAQWFSRPMSCRVAALLANEPIEKVSFEVAGHWQSTQSPLTALNGERSSKV